MKAHLDQNPENFFSSSCISSLTEKHHAEFGYSKSVTFEKLILQQSFFRQVKVEKLIHGIMSKKPN